MDLSALVTKTLVFGLPYLASLYVVVGVALLPRAPGGRRWFSFLLFAVAVYCFGYFLELNTTTLDAMLRVREFELLGALFVPPLGVLFVAELTGRRVGRTATAVLLGVSASLWVALLTNSLHHGFYVSVELSNGIFTVPRTVRGPFYYLFLSYVGFFLVWSSFRLARVWRKSRECRRRASLGYVFLTLQLPWVALALILAGADKNLDPVPAMSAVIAALFLVNELRNGMFDLQVIRWKRLFAEYDEPAFLLNHEHDLVGTNLRARELLTSLPGGIAALLQAVDQDRHLVQVAVGEESLWFSVTVSPYDSSRLLTNYLLTDVSAYQRASERIRTLLGEKELILREVHHRIKNNMGTIIGLLTLQADALPEGESSRALEDAADRMRGMAVLYQKLYQAEDLGAVSTARYFPPLAHEILANFPHHDRVETRFEVEDFLMEERTVQSLGIVLNELLTNAMKYAFGVGPGHLTVALTRHEGRITLRVADNGKGLPQGADLASSEGFGLTLVKAMAQQLAGAVRLEPGPGTRIEVEIPG